MTDPKTMPDLEAALIERAKRLADEYLARGRDSHKAILSEERERLRAREERIDEEAQADADRLFRRRVQAAQLRLQGTLDRERWNLIQSVIEEIPAELTTVCDNREVYESLLKLLLAKAAESIGEDELVASFNARDHKVLESRWDEFVTGAAPHATIELDPDPVDSSGGVRVSSKDRRVSVDATFEGRSERFRDELIQAIAERLFAHANVQAG